MGIFFGIIKAIYYILVIPVGLFSFFVVTKQEKAMGIKRHFAGSWLVVGCSYVLVIPFLVMGVPEVFRALAEGKLVSIYNFFTWAIGYALYYHSYKVFDKEATLAARAEFAADSTNVQDSGFSYTVTTYEDGSKSNNFLSSMLYHDFNQAAAPIFARILLVFISICYAPIMCYFNLIRFYALVLLRQRMGSGNQPQNS